VKTRRFLPSLIAVAVVVPLAIWALATIRLQTELLPLLPPDLPSVQGMQLFQSAFRSAQEVMVVIEQPDPATVTSLRDRLAAVPSVESVTVLGEMSVNAMVQSVGWLLANLPPSKFTELRTTFRADNLTTRLTAVREELSGAVTAEEVARARLDPLGIMRLLGGADRFPLPRENAPAVAVLAVRARTTLQTFEECQQFVAAVSAGAVGTGALITGRPAFVAESSRQMQRDMFVMLSVALTLTGAAFWLFYRSLRALLWILVLQVLAVLTGVIAARLLFGELNVLSIGFAAILLGVGMDYCILVYHHHAHRADASHWPVLRRAIWLSALTTAASFGILYFSGFPGLQQLAVLIATGLLATAFFATELEPLFLERKPPQAPAWLDAASGRLARFIERRRTFILVAMVGSVVAVTMLAPVWRAFPFYDADVRRLRPTNSEAYRALDSLLQHHQTADAKDVIVIASSAPALRAQVDALGRAVGVSLSLLPAAEDMAVNRTQWERGRAPAVRAAFDEAGFEEEWAAPTVLLVETLDSWSAGTEEFVDARRLLANTVQAPDGRWLALARLPGTTTWEQITQAAPDSLPANWGRMTDDLGQFARTDFRRLSLWMLGAVVGLCWVAHRSARLVGLNLVALVISVAGLLVLLWVTRTSMTLLSLLAIPLLVGLIIDISLHLVLALEESGGDLRVTFQRMAAPVCLTGLTTMIGFGAPMLTAQPALQNFGFVMDLGILSAVVTGLVLLPTVYAATHRRPGYSQTLYRAQWFDAGVWIAKTLGQRGARVVGRWAGALYRVTHPRTVAAVRGNLALTGAAPAAVRRTFANYGETLADYFLLGSLPRPDAEALVTERIGLEHLQAAHGAGKGMLVVTAHLGLFELGSLLMNGFESSLVALSLPEPSPALNKWRAAYRRRWGVETMAVGDDQFGFVQITRELTKGRAVAMLADRPHGNQFVPVAFPGGAVPFATGPVWLSLLAGCPIVAVTVVRLPTGGYRVAAHPPLQPRWLPGGREETVEHYTRELAAIFQKVICAYPDQWYQFVPLSPLR